MVERERETLTQRETERTETDREWVGGGAI